MTPIDHDALLAAARALDDRLLMLARLEAAMTGDTRDADAATRALAALLAVARAGRLDGAARP